jgi:hypothetical protein
MDKVVLDVMDRLREPLCTDPWLETIYVTVCLTVWSILVYNVIIYFTEGKTSLGYNKNKYKKEIIMKTEENVTDITETPIIRKYEEERKKILEAMDSYKRKLSDTRLELEEKSKSLSFSEDQVEDLTKEIIKRDLTLASLRIEVENLNDGIKARSEQIKILKENKKKIENKHKNLKTKLEIKHGTINEIRIDGEKLEFSILCDTCNIARSIWNFSKVSASSLSLRVQTSPDFSTPISSYAQSHINSSIIIENGIT